MNNNPRTLWRIQFLWCFGVSRKFQKLALYCLILLIPFLILFTRGYSFLPVKQGSTGFLTPFLQVLKYPILEAKKIIFYRQIFNEYRQLRDELSKIQKDFVKQEDIIRENIRYRELLDFKKSTSFPSVPAYIIGRSPDSWHSSFILNRGEDAGIQNGMPVVTPLGVVGKITETGKSVSKVILLNDPAHSVAAVVQRSRESGLVQGSLQGICRMLYLSQDADVKKGDKVVTARMSTAFPEGLLIGEVTEVRKDVHNTYTECVIQPAVLFSQVEEVLVIKKGINY